MSRGSAAERDDVRALALAAVLVPLTWYLLLGWSWPRSVAGHDGLALAQNLLAVREVAQSGRGWSSLMYRSDLLGGSVVRDVAGPFPLFPWLASLGLSPTGILDVAVFVMQALLGFLGFRAMQDLAEAWGAPERPGIASTTTAVWLCAFTPMLGWRLGYGHLNLVAGLLPFAAGLALLVGAALDRLTATLVLVAVASLVLGLLHSGQQIVVYGLVFGGPILAGAWLSLGGRWRRLAVPVLVTLGAAILALPWLWPMLVHARGSDAARSLGGTVVVYDFVTSTASDWLTSLPWSTASLPAAREASLHHEVNYPLGPLVVLLALVPWRRTRALAIGLAVSLLAVLAFSLDLRPLSSAFLALLPPLRSFRVPARAILPWLWAVPILAAAAILCASRMDPPATPDAQERRRKRKPKPSGLSPQRALFVAVAMGGALFVAPSLVREASAWLVAVVVVVARRRKQDVPAAAVLVVMSACNVAAFRERLLPFEDGGVLLAEAEQIGASLRRAKPELESGLSRVHLNDFEITAFTVNTAFAAGLSSLDGYAVPTRRFAELVFALRGARYEPTAVFFRFRKEEPAFGVLRQLYNVTWNVALPSPGSMTVAPAGEAAGPAWFSTAVSHTKDVASLSHELTGAGRSLHDRVKETLWLVDGDPFAAAAALPPAIDARCRAARVTRVEAPARGREIVADVESPAACPLTFATNFTESLRAMVVLANGQQVPAAVFPAYGALAGVLVPEGSRHVRAAFIRDE
jgi:hypothetical protein